MKAPSFDYARARSLDEALALLQRHGDEARLLAGGQSLMPALNMRLAAPRWLIDISRLRELAGIHLEQGQVRIGALVTHAAIGASGVIRAHLPLLCDAAKHIAHPAVRNAGTFGGSLAMADPAAEWPACCVALNARITLASAAGKRQVGAREFFQGLYTTAIQPRELLTEVVIPIPGAKCRHVFLELARRRGDYATVGVAALANIEQGVIQHLQLTCLGAGDTPVAADRTSQVFVFKIFSESLLDEALAQLEGELSPTADLYSSAATKRHLLRVLTARALRQVAV